MPQALARICICVVLSIVSVASLATTTVFPVVAESAACSLSPSHTSADFCAGFKAAVYCNCHAKHGPEGMCKNPSAIYNVMKVQYARFGKDWLMHMCQDRKGSGVSVAECMDQWTCFMTGSPFDSAHGACGEPKC